METMARKAKDSLFADLFTQDDYLLELYRTLHPEDTQTRVSDLRIVTIERVLTEGRYNDLGFTVGSRLTVLVEAQSTWSVNIVTRMLLYVAETYRRYLEDEGASLHETSLVNVPAPELYVIYTGLRQVPDRLSLTRDVLGSAPSAIEVAVRVLRGGGDDVIGQYVAAARVVDEVRGSGLPAHEKARAVVEACIDRGILVPYFERRRAEVTDIMFTLFDQERETRLYHERIRKRATEEGYSEGYNSGRADGYDSGYDSGRADGYDSGYDSGRADGYDSGRADGLSEGLSEGRSEGRSAALAESVANLVRAQGISVDQAMDALGIPDDERAVVAARL